jgi:hypothetical protein
LEAAVIHWVSARRKTMEGARFLRIGGYVSGGVLILFGIAVIALGIRGFTFTRDHISFRRHHVVRLLRHFPPALAYREGRPTPVNVASACLQPL